MADMVDEFEKVVDALVKKLPSITLEERNAVIDAVCETYVVDYDKIPDSYQLLRLSNVILHEDLTNPDTYKVQNEEFPFHSESQKKRRNRREFTVMDSTIEHMKFKVDERLSTSPPNDNRK